MVEKGGGTLILYHVQLGLLVGSAGSFAVVLYVGPLSVNHFRSNDHCIMQAELLGMTGDQFCAGNLQPPVVAMSYEVSPQCNIQVS